MRNELPFWKRFLLDEHSPRCSALLIAVGMFFGLLPKENALAGMLLLLLVLIPGRLIYGILALVVFTFLSIPLDVYADRVGNTLHENMAFASFGSFFYTLPFGAWTRIDNTVVLGHFVLGSILFLPVYATSVWVLNPTKPVKPTKQASSQNRSEKDKPPQKSAKKNVKDKIPVESSVPLVEPDDDIEAICTHSPGTQSLKSTGKFSVPKTGRFR